MLLLQSSSSAGKVKEKKDIAQPLKDFGMRISKLLVRVKILFISLTYFDDAWWSGNNIILYDVTGSWWAAECATSTVLPTGGLQRNSGFIEGVCSHFDIYLLPVLKWMSNLYTLVQQTHLQKATGLIMSLFMQDLRLYLKLLWLWDVFMHICRNSTTSSVQVVLKDERQSQALLLKVSHEILSHLCIVIFHLSTFSLWFQ